MSKKTLQIGEGLAFPAEEFIESATALVSQRGRGKSGGVRVIEEELLIHRLPFVTIDPVGIHWGLRSSFNGKEPSGHELLVVGGEHGDLPLERRGGEDVAQGVVEDNASVVIDLNGQTKGAQREFVRDFADGLYRLNNASRLVILEETPEFAPQRLISSEIAQTFEAVERIVRLGRNKGLGALLVGQRPATINKDLLTQVDSIICLGINSPQDRKALKEWVEQNAEPERLKEFMEGISTLERQEAWIWSPAQLKLFRRFRFRDFTTLHPDKTHLRRLGLLKTVPAQTDVSGLVQRLHGAMKQLAEKRKTDDPKTLRGRVAELERALAAAKTAKAPAPKVERVEVPVIPSGQVKTLSAAAEKLEATATKANEAAQAIRATLHAQQRLAQPPHMVAQRPVARPVAPSPSPVPRAPAAAGEPGSLDKAERAILTVLAQHPDGCESGKLTLLAGYRWSGGFRNALSSLRSKGFIVGENSSVMHITDEGAKALGTYDPLPSGKNLHNYWLNHPSLGLAERTILQALLEVHPEGLTSDQLTQKTGYTWSGGFRNALSSLRTAGLLVGRNTETMQASGHLFTEATT